MRLPVLLAVAFSSAFSIRAQDRPSAPHTSAEELVRSGIAAEHRGDLDSAVREFSRALALRPNLSSAHEHLGLALAALGRYDEALEQESVALALSPSDPAIQQNHATVLYKMGDYNRARAELEAVRRGHPHDLAPALLLSYTYIKLGRPADALGLLKPFEQSKASDPDLKYAITFARIVTGDPEGVPRMEAIARDRKMPDAWMISGTARFEQGEFPAARSDAEEALKLDPRYPGASTLLGKAFWALGQHEAAIAPLQAGLRLNPMDFDANLYLATVRLERGDYAAAEPMLDLALQLRPGYPLARLEKAKLLERTGRDAEAVSILQELVELKPDWTDAHWELATAYFKLDRNEEGKRERAIVENLRRSSAVPPATAR